MEFLELCEELRLDEKPTLLKEAIIARCEYDLSTFALVFFPHYCTDDFNKFHSDFIRVTAIREAGARRAFVAPRGAAKSTFATLIKPIHDICYGLEKFILIISNTEKQSVAKLRDIRAELLENDNLRDHFGNFFDRKKVAETKYIAGTRGHYTMLMAIGAGTEIRGARYGAYRPSKIICDDVEHSEEVYTEDIREKFADWYKEVVSQLGDKNTIQEIVGTLLHPKALLANLTKNPRYDAYKYQSVLCWSEREDLWEQWRKLYWDFENDNRKEDSLKFYNEHKEEMTKGTDVLWPERENYYQLMVIREEIGNRAFQKEKQNNPLMDDRALFTKRHFFTEVAEGLKIESSGAVIPWNKLRRAFGAMDPATGQTKAKKGNMGDFTCMLVGYSDTKGRLFVYDDYTKRASPTEYIQKLFDTNEKYNYEKFGVETNLYRNLLLENIMREKKEREKARQKTMSDWKIDISFYDIENVENKQKRIYSLEPKVANGYILFNRALSGEFNSQMEAFPTAEHDDCPDCLEMLWGLTNNRFKVSPINSDPLKGRY